ncbi:MAG: class I SAM-dependent methyltransferase [Thermoplasmata archaeon]|nr:class I SAM-dependent methyltransferase family protein [Thermoplasmata archaeon]
MISKAIKVELRYLNENLNFLKEKGILNRNLKIRKDGNIAYIPVLNEIEGIETLEMDFETIEKIKSYREFLNLSKEIIDELPKSYDIIGDIIIIKLKNDFLKYSNEIGEALLKFHKNMKTVALDLGVQGELRIRNLKVIAGDGLDTIHKENGIRIFVNPGESYFSPRLASERMRVLNKVKDGETIIDMFCGVGPFSILIGKNRNVKIYAIDKNEKAIGYLKKSIEINKINNVFPIAGDVKEKIDELPLADRIIMDLPLYSMNFLDLALKKSKKGGIIHIYVITENEDEILEQFKTKFNIMEKGIVHGYSPKENLFYFDLQVK